jgi:hypothetical protein
MMNLKKASIITVVMAMVLLPVLESRAVASTIDIGTTTFTISKLGDLTLVLKEGVPQTIVVRGKELTGMGVGFGINGAPYMGDVLLTNNLTLVPGTMPLTFEHYGVIEFTVGTDKLVLQYNGTAKAMKDMAMLTKTLNSYVDFVIADGIGAFAGLKGMKGTYTLTLMCHIVPGATPQGRSAG